MQPTRDAAPAGRVLVIRTDHLGDIVLATPLVRALAEAGWVVEVLVPAAMRAVFAGNPGVRACHAMEVVAPGFPKGWTRLARWIRAGRFDAVLLPYARPRELLWASCISGVRRRVAMWAGVWGRVTGHRCLRSRIKEEPRHFAEISLECARALNVPPRGAALEWFVTSGEAEWAARGLQERFGARRLLGVHPGCAGNACNLPAREYGRLVELMLAHTDCGIVVTGTAGERGLWRDWPAEVVRSPRVWNAMGEMNLRQLAAVLARLEVLVCPSTGPLHVASALGVATVSPFCARPTLSPTVWGNRNANAAVVVPEAEACRSWGEREPGHCDFRGLVVAEDLWRRVVELRARGGAAT